jgi:hypothetical protein
VRNELDQVQEQRSRIAVAGISVIPDKRRPTRFQIAGNDGRLPSARRRSDPDNWALSHRVQLPKQSLAWQRIE